MTRHTPQGKSQVSIFHYLFNLEHFYKAIDGHPFPTIPEKLYNCVLSDFYSLCGKL